MIEDLNVFSGFVSVAFISAIVAGLLVLGLRPLLRRLAVERVLWQPILLDLTLFLFLWWGLSVLADRFLSSLGAR
jgi:hypothetical protein